MQRNAFCVALTATILSFSVEGLVARSVDLQQVFASRVVGSNTNAQAGGGNFDPQAALGAPDGFAGTHSLGIGGSLTLGFDVTIVDGPGVDLIVSENPFASTTAPWETFAELCFVEVSSNGVDFARIPNVYSGPQVEPGAFGFVNAGHYQGFGGVLATRSMPADPQSLVGAGGDGIDLADLRSDPLVMSGAVDLGAISEVRLVDVRSGVDTDSNGNLIRDPSTGSADIDAVTVVQHSGNQSAFGPSVVLDVPASGAFTVTVSDPDGWADLDPARFEFALWGNQLRAADLFALTVPSQISATSFTLSLPGPLPLGFSLQIAVAVADQAGNRSSASRSRP